MMDWNTYNTTYNPYDVEVFIEHALSRQKFTVIGRELKVEDHEALPPIAFGSIFFKLNLAEYFDKQEYAHLRSEDAFDFKE